MRNVSLLIAGLLTIIMFLFYQLLELKQEVRNNNNNSNQVVTMQGNLGLIGQNNLSGGTSQDGYWLYKEDEKQVYFFRYDKEKDSIIQIKKNIRQ
ncbi:hypothetical protein [Paenibacillus sp. HJGM_3]|uniref:hypothetical protein n=1 Tax=Paenibacillus sp. HJGM_3 TaxID=3379816 RepID=UPI00385BD5EF